MLFFGSISLFPRKLLVFTKKKKYLKNVFLLPIYIEFLIYFQSVRANLVENLYKRLKNKKSHFCENQ